MLVTTCARGGCWLVLSALAVISLKNDFVNANGDQNQEDHRAGSIRGGGENLPRPDSRGLRVDPHPIPSQPPAGYFNYDNNTPFGPNNWRRVDTSQHWLKEFGPNGFGPWKGALDYDPSQNQCGANVRRQSPKDMRPTTDCEAIHEIRTWCGSVGVGSDIIDAKILPHKLSLSVGRRPCLNVENRACRQNQPPRADYPRYASAGTSYADLINYDIKVPSEHTIRGKRFDAEVQMFHIHPVGFRLSSIGVLIEARDGQFNQEFQDILDTFAETYQFNEFICDRQRNLQTEFGTGQEAYFDFWAAFEEKRNATDSSETVPVPLPSPTQPPPTGGSFLDQLGSYEFPDLVAAEIESGIDQLESRTSEPSLAPSPAPSPQPSPAPVTPRPTTRPRTLQQRKFNPYSDALMPTIFFYRYNGGITEPPCKDITWWVMTEPMIIAPQQLEQLQRIMFTNKDPSNDCNPSSVHNAAQSVARPTQPLGSDRNIQDCSAGSFVADIIKNGSEAKKCRY